MAGYPGNPVVSGTVSLSASTDTYATHWDINGRGGAQGLPTLSAMNAVPSARRNWGMKVTVYADSTPANNKTYQLCNIALGGNSNTITDNLNWIPDTISILGIGSISQGDILVGSSTNTINKLSIGTSNQILGVNNTGTTLEYKTVSNGLTSGSGSMKLGGTLTANTTIPISTYTLTLGTFNTTPYLAISSTTGTFSSQGVVAGLYSELDLSATGAFLLRTNNVSPIKIWGVASDSAGVHLFYSPDGSAITSTARNSIYINSSTITSLINGTIISQLSSSGLYFGSGTATGKIHLPAVTTSAGSAPIKLTLGGTLMTTTEAGAIEATNTHIYWTDSTGTRRQLDQQGGSTLAVAGGTNEIQTNNGSGNLGAGKVFISANGNLQLGDNTLANNRTISAVNAATTASLSLLAQADVFLQSASSTSNKVVITDGTNYSAIFQNSILTIRNNTGSSPSIFSGGDGILADQNGNTATLKAGSAYSGSGASTGNGGNIYLIPGTGFGSGTAGSIYLSSANSQFSTTTSLPGINISSIGIIRSYKPASYASAATFTIGAAIGQTGSINGETLTLLGGDGLTSSNGNGGNINIIPGLGRGSGSNGNIQLFYNPNTFGGGVGVLYIYPAITLPTTSISSGGVMYIKSTDNLPYWWTGTAEYPMTGGGGSGPTSGSGITVSGTTVNLGGTTTANVNVTGGYNITLDNAPIGTVHARLELLTTGATYSKLSFQNGVAENYVQIFNGQIDFNSTGASSSQGFNFINSSGYFKTTQVAIVQLGGSQDDTQYALYAKRSSDGALVFSLAGAFTNRSNTFNSGTKQTFGPSSTSTAGVNFTPGVVPTSPVTGDLYFDGTHLYFKSLSGVKDLLAGNTYTAGDAITISSGVIKLGGTVTSADIAIDDSTVGTHLFTIGNNTNFAAISITAGDNTGAQGSIATAANQAIISSTDGGSNYSSVEVANGALNISTTKEISVNGSAGTAGQFLKSNGPGNVPTWANSTGGGITNSAVNTELMMSNGTNAVSSKIFATSGATGNMTLGDTGLSGSARTIAVTGSTTNVGLTFSAKGTGNFTFAAGATSTIGISPVSKQIYSANTGTMYIIGYTDTAGSDLDLAGGTGTSTTGGNLYLRGGAGSTEANYGTIFLSSHTITIGIVSGTVLGTSKIIGGSGNSGNNNGVAVTLSGGNAYTTSGNGNGGTLILRGGTKNGTGTNGNVQFPQLAGNGAGYVAIDNSGNISWSAGPGGGGGITNTAANTELMMSNSTNAVPSGVFIPSTGNVNLGGSTTTGTSRTIQSDGSSTNIGVAITTKGTGSVSLYPSNFATSLTLAGNGNVVLSGTYGSLSSTFTMGSGGIALTTGTAGTISFGNTNIGFFNSSAGIFGGGLNVIYIEPASTNPTTSVSTGGVMFVKSSDSKPYWRIGTTDYVMIGGGGFSDPLTTNGDIIARISGTTTRLAQGANNTFLGVNGSGVLGYYTVSGGSLPFADNTALLKNNTDNTKLAIISAASITTGTTRTYTLPDANMTFARNDAAQTFAGIQTFSSSPLLPTPTQGDNSTKGATTAYVDTLGNTKQAKLLTFNNQTASYTLVLADADRSIEVDTTSNTNLTIPLNSSVSFSVGVQIPIFIKNTGTLTVQVASGTITLRSSAGSNTSAGQNTTMFLVQRATDDWYLINGTPSAGGSGGGVTIQNISSSTTLTTAANKIYNVFIDATAGNVLITNPTGDTSTIFNIRRIDSSTNTVTFSATIQGFGASGTNLLAGSGFTMSYNGTNFYCN